MEDLVGSDVGAPCSSPLRELPSSCFELEWRSPACFDAVESVAYSFESDGARLVIASDLGRAEEGFVDFLREATTLLVEMNHDEDMLRDGPYTWPLKKRISGSYFNNVSEILVSARSVHRVRESRSSDRRRVENTDR